MKFSLNWLQQLTKIPLTAQQLSDRLCTFGLEVEGIEPLCDKVSGIVSGKITKIVPHPDADRLVITTFWDGNTSHQIVTGATNVYEGAVVPASLPSAVLADGTVIKSGVLRGVESHGMLCSQSELGIQTEASGIWILPEDTPLGVDIKTHFQLNDAILEVSILPNRGDCKSHFGLAREIQAMLTIAGLSESKTPLSGDEISANHYQPSDFSKTLYTQKYADTFAPFYIEDPADQPSEPIPFSAQKINDLLGTEWAESDMVHALGALGFELKNENIIVPAWRQNDVKNTADIAEEVARSLGLDTIPMELPRTCIPVTPPTALQKITQSFEHTLVGLGMQQLNTLPLIGAHTAAAGETVHALQNPLSPELAIMRTSILPSLLQVLSHNTRHFSPHHRLFEIGKVFQENEKLVLGILITAPLYEPTYTAKEKAAYALTFSDLKGIAEILLEKHRTIQPNFGDHSDPRFHPIQQAQLKSGKTEIGQVGFLHPQYLEKFDLKNQVGYIELNLSVLSELPTPKLKAKSFSKFPSTRRDMAFLAPKSLKYAEILAAIKSQKTKWLSEVVLFDQYSDPSWTEDVQSLGIGLLYQDPNGTLTDDQVNTTHQELCKALSEKLPIQFR
jgi:phenylalanyl-tRNA synthetase beta subunit